MKLSLFQRIWRNGCLDLEKMDSGTEKVGSLITMSKELCEGFGEMGILIKRS